MNWAEQCYVRRGGEFQGVGRIPGKKQREPR
jgi:hypothetical protein